jgi:ribosomal subunit interface protein
MNIQIDGSNLEISPRIKRMIGKKLVDKLDQLLPRFNNEIKTAFLHLKKDKYRIYTVKFGMILPGKDGQINAENKHPLLISAIIGLREQVEKQIKKYKSDQVNYSL